MHSLPLTNIHQQMVMRYNWWTYIDIQHVWNETHVLYHGQTKPPPWSERPEGLWLLTSSPHAPGWPRFRHAVCPSCPRVVKPRPGWGQLGAGSLKSVCVLGGPAGPRRSWASEECRMVLLEQEDVGAARSFHGALHACLPVFRGNKRAACRRLQVLIRCEASFSAHRGCRLRKGRAALWSWPLYSRAPPPRAVLLIACPSLPAPSLWGRTPEELAPLPLSLCASVRSGLS